MPLRGAEGSLNAWNDASSGTSVYTLGLTMSAHISQPSLLARSSSRRISTSRIKGDSRNLGVISRTPTAARSSAAWIS